MTDWTPLIIIGAPRSGTNMLRDVLTRLPGFSTWPCDEINYIWRYGHASYPTDIFTPEMATLQSQGYIRRQFERLAEKSGAGFVVEKTCANSLRVDYIDKVLPEAKYLFIVRNGLDVVDSASLRWKAELDIPYLLKKARYVPLRDLPYYAFRYLKNRLHRLTSKDRQLAFWGPALDEMQTILANHTLREVCALQWQACVERSLKSFVQMDEQKWCRLDYETFVSDPRMGVETICEFLGCQTEASDIEQAVGPVSAGSVGKGASRLTDDERARIVALVGSTLERCGYHV